MEKLMTVDGLKKGDKLVQVTYAQGVGGVVTEHDRVDLTVVKVNKATIEVDCAARRYGFRMRKGADLTGRWSYGMKHEYFKA